MGFIYLDVHASVHAAGNGSDFAAVAVKDEIDNLPDEEDVTQDNWDHLDWAGSENNEADNSNLYGEDGLLNENVTVASFIKSQGFSIPDDDEIPGPSSEIITRTSSATSPKKRRQRHVQIECEEDLEENERKRRKISPRKAKQAAAEALMMQTIKTEQMDMEQAEYEEKCNDDDADYNYASDSQSGQSDNETSAKDDTSRNEECATVKPRSHRAKKYANKFL